MVYLKVFLIIALLPTLNSVKVTALSNETGPCEITLLLDGVTLNPNDGLTLESAKQLTVVLDELGCKKDINEEINLELTLARGIRPLENNQGKRIRVLKSPNELSKYSLSELLGPAKPGDRLILNFTNTGLKAISIELL